VSFGVDGEKIRLRDNVSLTLITITNIAPVGLEPRKNDHVKALVDVHAVRGISNHLDVICPRTSKECERIVGDVSIDKKKSTAVCSLGPSVRIPVFKLVDTDLAVDIALFRVSESFHRSVKAQISVLGTHEAFSGLSCFQLAWNASPL
jgi:hypothetical protein